MGRNRLPYADVDLGFQHRQRVPTSDKRQFYRNYLSRDSSPDSNTGLPSHRLRNRLQRREGSPVSHNQFSSTQHVADWNILRFSRLGELLSIPQSMHEQEKQRNYSSNNSRQFPRSQHPIWLNEHHRATASFRVKGESHEYHAGNASCN